ncbi:fatty acid desaturase [Halomonas sp. Y3]|uniref:fatty acid desaturase n=1 Tax=Halomonas sp. Y3 TaxID=2956797 RepID=UPI00209EEFEC|nr:fatty acid desaturase [Halomonas sp. Y3]
MSLGKSEIGNTRYCNYGYQYNVREAYKGLPFQFLWTWVTGKGVELNDSELSIKKSRSSEVFLVFHLIYTWALLALSFLLGAAALTNISLFWWVIPISWVISVNRLRSLQATFHYMTHGSVVKDVGRAKLYSLIFLTTPLLYVCWDRYRVSHVREHHHLRVLCTETDPDQEFIAQQGFRLGMPEREYWLKVWLTPLRPDYLVEEWWGLIKDNFIYPSRTEVVYRATFWGLIIAIVSFLGIWLEFCLLFLVPRLIMFPHSMWLQLITEHLWFYQKGNHQTRKELYGNLTWGRFQGRPVPETGIFKKFEWVVKIFILDVPVRLYIYPQDLPNHDFHHRMPSVSYKNIADVRASYELKPSDYGPMLEVWGFMSTLYMIRDHLCRGLTTPFRLSIDGADVVNVQGERKCSS